ncbi:hypothetical protein BJX62DRAFT_237114 [Aspergillus germanicus]
MGSPLIQRPVSFDQTGNGKLDPTFYGGTEYFPFEGAGVISKWAIELANELRQKDYSAISDIELDITYIALAGGDKHAALKAAAADLATGSNVASIDLINDLKGDEEEEAPKPIAGEIELSGFPSLLPHITSRGTTTIKGLELFLKSRAGIPEHLTPKVNGKPLDTRDSLGSFLVVSSEESFDIAETWTITLEEGENPWKGNLDEAWLLISYTVSGLVKG